MKQPSLKFEDGAELFCEIQRVEGGGFQASCYAWSEAKSEDHDFHVCASEEDGRAWIASHAKRRGFPTYWLKLKAAGAGQDDAG
jgi:hypothetical protein